MKIYIAGSITNNPNYMNQFKQKEKELTELGHTVLNPVKNKGSEYREYIDMGLCELMKCDAIYMLNGWRSSKGAVLELTYANTVGLEIEFEEDEQHEK